MTEQELAEIETMAGLGLSFEEIASIKGICDDTLKKHAKPFLKKGKAKAKAQVAQTAYRMAISGKIPSMTMFWLKTQAGWQEGRMASDTVESNLSSLVDQINQSSKPSQVLLAYLAEVLEQLRQGVLNPKVASSIASMSNILLKAAEQGQLEERLASLERVIKSQMPEPLDLEFELDAVQAPMTPGLSEKGNLSRRLSKLEANLTPKRLMLHYLKQVRSCSGFAEANRLLYSNDFKIWFEQGLANMRTSVQAGVQGEQEKENAVRVAYQELNYLNSLSLWPCEAYETECRNIHYRFACIALLIKNKPANHLTIWSDEEKHNFSLAKRMIEHLWLELKVIQLTEAKISQPFFDGLPLLMSDQRQSLDQHLNLLEEVLELLAKIVSILLKFSQLWQGKKGASQMRTFLKELAPGREMLLKVAEQQAEIQFSEARRQARIAVYLSEDRQDEVRKIYQQMVNGNSDPPAKTDFEPESL